MQHNRLNGRIFCVLYVCPALNNVLKVNRCSHSQEKNALHSPTCIDTLIRFFVLEPFNFI